MASFDCWHETKYEKIDEAEFFMFMNEKCLDKNRAFFKITGMILNN